MRRTTAPRPGAYMFEIDGVRGIALALVVLFHVFGHGRVSGGVDVFLVLSAFFLTRKLLTRFADPARPGTDGAWLRTHFSGVATRLIPSAAIVLLFVLVATRLWTPLAGWAQNIREVIASALYYENWELISSQLAYGAAGPSTSPLQHFWSLSVQGQFFLAWPLLAWALWAIARRRAAAPTAGGGRGDRAARDGVRAQRDLRTALLGVTIVLTVTSFAWALVLVRTDQQVAYFSTFSRFWELGVGALIAFVPAGVLAHRAVREAAVWAGTAMVVASGFLFDGAALFPGPAALWPVGAAALVLFGASRGAPEGTAAAVLGSAPVRFVARIAYALYLWHWPLLVFYLQARGYAQVGWKGGLLVIGVSAVLAVATERLVSWLFGPRRANGRSDAAGATPAAPPARPAWNWRRGLALPLAPVIAVTAISLAWGGAVSAQQAAALEAAAHLDADHIGARALTDPEAAAAVDADAEVLPTVDTAYTDRASIYAEGCVQSPRSEPGSEEVLVCDVDDYGDRHTVVMTGGSYVAQWYPALRSVAEAEGWRLVVIEKNGCRLRSDSEDAACAEWNRNAIDVIASYDPDLVFTLGSAVKAGTLGADGETIPGSETIPEGNLDQIRELEARGIEVVGVRGTPKFPVEIPTCLAEAGTDAAGIAACTTARADIFEPALLAEAEASGSLPENLRLIDLTDAICGPEACEPIVGNVLAYRDNGHMTATFAGTLAPALSAALEDAVPELF